MEYLWQLWMLVPLRMAVFRWLHLAKLVTGQHTCRCSGHGLVGLRLSNHWNWFLPWAVLAQRLKTPSAAKAIEHQ